MKKDRFYNILFPLWFFLFIPSTWLFLITFLGNAAIDSLVLALGCKMNHRPFVTTWKKSFLWVFAFGYLADFLGGVLLFILSTVLDNPLAYAMMFNPFSSFAGFLLVALMVAAAGAQSSVNSGNFDGAVFVPVSFDPALPIKGIIII